MRRMTDWESWRESHKMNPGFDQFQHHMNRNARVFDARLAAENLRVMLDRNTNAVFCIRPKVNCPRLKCKPHSQLITPSIPNSTTPSLLLQQDVAQIPIASKIFQSFSGWDISARSVSRRVGWYSNAVSGFCKGGFEVKGEHDLLAYGFHRNIIERAEAFFEARLGEGLNIVELYAGRHR